jgi:hypothetical protein
VYFGFRPTELLKEYANDLRVSGSTFDACKSSGDAERGHRMRDVSSVCWLEDRDDRLARARALAETDPSAALALVDSVLAEAPDDPEALRAKGTVLVDVADAEREPARAVTLYERAIALLERAAGDPDLAAARRGLATIPPHRHAP